MDQLTVENLPVFVWLALPVGNEGPSTFTGWSIGDETSLIPYELGQLVVASCFLLVILLMAEILHHLGWC